MIILILISIFPCLLQLAPSVNLTADTAPHPGTAYTSYTFRFRQKLFTVSRRFNSLLPSFLSGGQNRNDDRRKKHNLTLSKESGIGYRKTHLISPTSAQILHFVQEWQAGIYCRFVRNFFTFLLILAPFVNLSVDTFPDKRGRLTFPILSFWYSFSS